MKSFTFTLVVLCIVSTIAQSRLCTVPRVGPGLCISNSTCNSRGGISHAGYCPNEKDGALCCTGIASNGANEIAYAAQSMVGKYPYSWGGGNDNGPTNGIVQSIDPYCDDRGVVGFDCSGLAKYAIYQGTGTSLPHDAQAQYDWAPIKIPLEGKQAGDLVFFGYSTSSIYHVAIYVGNNMIVEANGHNPDCSGKLVRMVGLYEYNLLPIVARYW